MARLPLAVAIWFAMNATAFAQSAPATTTSDTTAGTDAKDQPTSPADKSARTLDVVTVTAQKRSQNLQKVPISIQALGEQKLDELNITDFSGYAKMLPSISFDAGEGGGAVPYMRGLASGENSNHSGPLPSVGVYLDEQPVTTIGGVLDVHIYDVQRVEALAGPQGTLYGASSQAGTLRIITNKPDPTAFSSGYSFELNSVAHGGVGTIFEAFANVPISDRAAIRLVGWDEDDAGYIDNKHGTRTYSNGITIDNAGFAEKNANDVLTRGARAALKIDLNDNWSITPTVMTQHQDSNGNFANDPVVGKYATMKFTPEFENDRWTQWALTVQGKIGNFDLTYAYSHLNRQIDSEADYSDYTFWYDAYYQDYYVNQQGLPNYFMDYFVNNDGDPINPSQYIIGSDGFTKTSHELRISSPQDNRFRFLVGAFWQDQTHRILQNYKIAGDLADISEVTGWPDTWWLTNQFRKDHDDALFGEFSFDFTDKLTATAGLRHYRYDNSLKGFFGAGIDNGWLGGTYGESHCFSSQHFQGSPCVNLNDDVKKSGNIGRANLTYQINSSKMIYATWSEGFRPGGINRNGTVPPYLPDKLTNWELGWKTSWFDNSLTFNGAVFQEDWENIQFSFLPPGGSGLTVIRNVGGARIRGLEADLTWAATYNFRLNGGFSLYDAKLTENYCGTNDANGNPETHCASPLAPSGTRLPVSARFKANLTGRYTWDVDGNQIYLQGVWVHEGSRRSTLIPAEEKILGDLGSYNLFDLSAGVQHGDWSVDFYVKNLFDKQAELSKFTQCDTATCGASGLDPGHPDGQVYTIGGKPRTFGIRFTQNF